MKKPEAGNPKPEVKLKAESRKRKAVSKPVQKGPFGEEENNSAPDNYRDDIPKSELNENKSKIVNGEAILNAPENKHT